MKNQVKESKKQVVLDYEEYQGLLAELERIKEENIILKSGDSVLIVEYSERRQYSGGQLISNIGHVFPKVLKGDDIIIEFFEEKLRILDELSIERQKAYNDYMEAKGNYNSMVYSLKNNKICSNICPAKPLREQSKSNWFLRLFE